jgi:hypothetical protein
MRRLIGTAIWRTAEFLHVPLGKFASTIFGWMVGSGGTRL